MKILIDNGHGQETPGKRSPIWDDGSQLLEWSYTREIAARVVAELKAAKIDAQLLTPEPNDIGLNERCIRANRLAKVYGNKNTLVVSIHCNASATKGKANGWEIHTGIGHTLSDAYATVFFNEAKAILTGKPKKRMRSDNADGDPDFDSNFAILRDTTCPAVLTENLFMDNQEDCAFLLSEEGKAAIVQIHVNAIKKIQQLS